MGAILKEILKEGAKRAGPYVKEGAKWVGKKAKQGWEKAKDWWKGDKKKKKKDDQCPTGNCADKARCVLRPYKPDTCKPGRTGHHVVPDRVFRVGSRGSARIRGGVPEDDGLVICVDGSNLSRSREHGKIHAIYDPAERALGLANGGVAPLGELELLGAGAAAKVTGCNAAALAAQLRAYHQARGLGPGTPVRADPTGKLPVDPSKLGTGATPSGGPSR